MLGEEELKNKTVILKDMKQGSQETIPMDNLESELMRRAHREP
jgi:histidyl-tRNA synthetase